MALSGNDLLSTCVVGVLIYLKEGSPSLRFKGVPLLGYSIFIDPFGVGRKKRQPLVNLLKNIEYVFVPSECK